MKFIINAPGDENETRKAPSYRKTAKETLSGFKGGRDDLNPGGGGENATVAMVSGKGRPAD